MNENRLVGVELFCGVGGMSLGFEKAGVSVVAAFDSDPLNVQLHRKNFPACKTIKADLTRVSGSSIRIDAGLGKREIDVLFGGPPCQGFSLIGQRRVDDPRNLLIYDFARLVDELRPRYFIMENVEGLLKGKAKSAFAMFLQLVDLAGYEVVSPVQVLDAQDYGVPQRRRRVFVLGALRGLPMPRYPNSSCNSDRRASVRNGPCVWDAIRDLPEIEKVPDLLHSDVYEGVLGEPTEYARSLRGRGNESNLGEPTPRGHTTRLTGCLRTDHTADVVRRFNDTEPGTSEPISRFHRLSKDGVCPTLRAGTGPDNGSFMAARPIHPVYPRCITVREAARLHSYPDWFDFHATKWHGFRQVGNSVPPLLAEAVAVQVVAAVKDRIQTRHCKD